MPVGSGRKSVPTAEKILRGNPGKRPLNDSEAMPQELGTLPPAPDYIGEYGGREWNRIGQQLIDLHLLTSIDLQVFEAYCLNVELMVRARESIQDNGMTVQGSRGPVRNPAIAAFGQATTAIRSLASEFGLSPSARSRIKLPTDDEETLAGLMGDVDTADDFDQDV
jgi:P27 family predicted phage terminase small subunit